MKKIFKQYMEKEAFEIFQEKLKEDEEFKIDKSNIQEFFECRDIQTILKENNIKYEAKLEEVWNGGYRSSKYHIQLSIFIKEEDYERIKKYFEVENTSNENEEEEYRPAKIVGYIKEAFYIIFALFIIGIGTIIFLQNIDSIIANIESIISAIIMIIVGAIILICRIIKYLTKKRRIFSE